MLNIIFIACGGALGAVLRYSLMNLVVNSTILRGQSFPYSTFIVNITGSLLAGIFYYFMIKYFEHFDPKIKNFLLIGFLGGYTTFSTICLDFFRLANANQFGLALAYISSSMILGVLALFFGFYLMKIIFA